MLGIVLGFGFGAWDSSEAVHEPLLVVPGDIVGGDVFDVGQGVQRAAAKRGIRAPSSPHCTLTPVHLKVRPPADNAWGQRF
ncbi:hypothetical protein BKG82_00960 [Mycobacteroides chelonae]|uniref:Uncharacterized protein n=1 Tax=Mycobacteroides chelonae TaxID=1774 RepID=A0A1S1LYJ3_MYCCH|nr:hypothetical protein AOT92_28215 [Mycobacteroides sp. H101]KRQ34186.1 hypothetical protein AOT91_06935 [Mycobacteroides sp. H092]KRQ44914.1 hypothetical protein AOT88_21405 [Mycobacteroides sp. H063]KRQ59678.1 hypothetical protein AOT90_21975 [Mycobacteroides sp. H079]KRQ63142.1 hypothetical protein AOT94_02060 [Mycobacteroides sp. HXVII]KRQ81641.1 hypothetical protein AOT93_11780 [Mycobacteroides sp. H110]KRQ85059.1 hypothetical protein AOT95_00515 [Mycobacteroides sp. HXXIII]OHU29152.1 